MERGYNKEYATKEANEIIHGGYLRPFERVLESFRPANQTIEEFADWCKSVGYINIDSLEKWKMTWREWEEDLNND